MANGGRRLETGTTLKNHCSACIVFKSMGLEHGKYGDHNHPFVASSRLPIGRHGNNDCARRSDIPRSLDRKSLRAMIPKRATETLVFEAGPRHSPDTMQQGLCPAG